MTVTDPLADMLTRIRNALTARKKYVVVPASKLKLEVAKAAATNPEDFERVVTFET